MPTKHAIFVTCMMVALSGCASNWDMQGHDPKDYYAQHPIKNRVETRYASHTLHFNRGDSVISYDAADLLREEWQDVRPTSAEAVQVQMHPSQMHNTARLKSVTSLLRRMGFSTDNIVFEPSENVARDDVQLDVAYVTVVSPRCPDWRTSPVTTYSNTPGANYGCANETNLGLMVEDPRDLVRGSASAAGADSTRTTAVVRDYRSGKDYSKNAGALSSSSSGDTAGGSDLGNTATPAMSAQ